MNGSVNNWGVDLDAQQTAQAMVDHIHGQTRVTRRFNPSKSAVLLLVDEDSTDRFKTDVAEHLGVFVGEIDNMAREERQRQAGKHPRFATNQANKVTKRSSKPGFTKFSRTPAGKKQLAKWVEKAEAAKEQAEVENLDVLEKEKTITQQPKPKTAKKKVDKAEELAEKETALAEKEKALAQREKDLADKELANQYQAQYEKLQKEKLAYILAKRQKEDAYRAEKRKAQNDKLAKEKADQETAAKRKADQEQAKPVSKRSRQTY